jgi:hypothetical protein
VRMSDDVSKVKHSTYARYWHHDRHEIIVMDVYAGAGSPGSDWKRTCQPLKDGRWAWMLTLPPREVPAKDAPLTEDDRSATLQI